MRHQKIVTMFKLTAIGLAAFVLAILALIGTAFFSDKTLLLIIVSLIVLCIVNIVGQRILLDQDFTNKKPAVRSASLLVLLSIFYVIVLMPMPGERPADEAGVQYWDLATGSRIAYVKRVPQTVTHEEPIIFLHGGPGVADLQGDVAYFGKLRAEGYIVYVYDQLGAGNSSRLQDPSGYTMERSAADLEEIRLQIGAERVILIGHSYGAGLAARYIAQHGEHVTKLIVSSPGALVDGLAGGDSLQTRLSASQKNRLYLQLLQPRALIPYILLQINPRAAHSFAGDLEMDSRFDRVYATTEPALHCRNSETSHPLHNLGFYANQFPQSVQAIPPKDIAQTLRQYRIPTLIVKGSCDYLSWASALEYLDVFQKGPAYLVYLRGAGHNIYQDKPGEFERNLKAFLKEQPLPDQYTGTQVPNDYELGY